MALESDSLGVLALAENLMRLDVAGKNSTATFMESSSTATDREAKSRPHKEKISENLRKIACQAP
jgi:hypothetical protein